MKVVSLLVTGLVLVGASYVAGAVEGVPPPSMSDNDWSASAPQGRCGPPAEMKNDGDSKDQSAHHGHRGPPPDGPPPDGGPNGSGGDGKHRPPPKDASGMPPAPQGCGMQ
ncbi:hypothetical protein [Silvimonas amylolytica]|uniref:Uncharacterized protein n=1 Tax=Silvimonas amylolytica TaxID=449663 RepID=A0ABQ2PMF3_9NEIS|nr:hypothetical protein [Silvimonas amylolytica]GGP26454.1 hypothetical protein GCM10010971_22730 [Silvimonas amylolytica]